MSLKSILSPILIAVVIVVILFVFEFSRRGERAVGVLETIDGIPFVQYRESILIQEKLAHADVYLREPVVFKDLVLDVEFNPGNLNSLSVGVRENPFWLSYEQIPIYFKASDQGTIRREITIPLSNKLQEIDRSIDIMFFGSTDRSTGAIDEGIHDDASWKLLSLSASVRPTLPSRSYIVDYIKSVISRERAL